MSEFMIQEKQRIRERMRSLRQALSPAEVGKASQAVVRTLVDSGTLNASGVICTYVGVGKEIQTSSLIQGLLETDRKIAVPDWEGWKQGSGLRVASIEGLHDLLSDNRIVPQPRISEGNLVSIEDLGVFVVPGLAFDTSGNRLGMGGGYFDRLLSLASPFATLVGLAYDFQVIERLPVGDHDVPLHQVICPERGIIQRDLHKRRISADETR